MYVGETEADAINRATLLVENMLQRPDQLQKVEQYKRRVQRKKLSVEAMLKTAMQSQLDGVRTGLSQLQTALVDLKEIKVGLSDIEEGLVRVPSLNASLIACREEYLKHSQYAAAMENLKHIFTVPDSIEKTKAYIAEGKLLNAHQCITDLENSRDDLLYELHKLPHQNPNETRLLREYFKDMQTLSQDLGKQLWLILQRTLNTVRKEPTQIVTALRIIEREERADQYAVSRAKGSNFLPPGRPKQWRTKALSVLESVVAQRLEGNQFEERADNKNWLIRHLEVLRLMLVEDLKVVRSQCVPCFPPSYNIAHAYIHMYHRNLAAHVVDLSERGLQSNETVTLLSWVLNTYPGPDLMGHPTLGIDTASLGPLIQETLLQELQEEYLKTVRSNYISWMGRALALEEDEWLLPAPPPQDGAGGYKTELPQLLHDMIRQNLDVAATISGEVQAEVLIISLEEAKLFALEYEKAILRYKDKYFADRSKIQYFTCYMIALGNSVQALVEVMSHVKTQFWRRGACTGTDKGVATQCDALSANYQHLRETVLILLMEEALTDLQEPFSALLTPPWVSDREPMDTIAVTLGDYFQDYTHLHPKNLELMVQMVLETVGVRYLSAILTKRMTLRNEEERKKVAARIVEDAESLHSVFESLCPPSEVPQFDSPCEVMKGLAEMIREEDAEFLGLETHRLLRRYPDLTSDHLTNLFLLRGDFPRLEVRKRVGEALEEARAQRGGQGAPPLEKTIFSKVIVHASIFP